MTTGSSSSLPERILQTLVDFLAADFMTKDQERDWGKEKKMFGDRDSVLLAFICQ